MSIPSIACIGIIGKHDNPLHIALFPPYAPSPPPPPPATDPKTSALLRRNHLDFSFLLNASLDIFDARARDRTRIDQDLGLLQHVDERLSLWGWLTGTGVKIVVVIDSWGKKGIPPGIGGGSASGSASHKPLERSGTGGSFRGRGKSEGTVKAVEDADLRPAFKALQTAYIRLLQNPFYVPDEHTPIAVAQGQGNGGPIMSEKFSREVARIGDFWKPGLSNL